MHPHVRYSADPHEGLEAQLIELRGLVKIVPPLIEADRRRRWDEIGARPGDPNTDMIDIYEREAGEEEGYGHAPYDRTLYSTAVVMSWEAYHFYLVRVLTETCLRYDLKAHQPLAQLVIEERRKWDRNFDAVKNRFRDFAEIRMDQLSSWEAVLHARELRNALVHNLGYYTDRYLKTKRVRRVTPDDIGGMTPSQNEADWVNVELIPLDRDFATDVITQLIRAGYEVREAVSSSGQRPGADRCS